MVPVPASNSSPKLTEILKELGVRVADLCRKDGFYVSPVLAAYTARVISLEQKVALDHLSSSDEEEVMRLIIQRLSQQDDPRFDAVRMQVAFESLYASELQKLRKKQMVEDQENSLQLDNIVKIGTNIANNTQVANLYRAIFKLMLSNSGVEKVDRNVEREVAAALESVFPQAGLNAFNLMTADEKRKQIKSLVSIVLGIRLFNREIKKGGAGVVDVPGLSQAEAESLVEKLETESASVGDLCFTYSDVINLELDKPGSIVASMERLQDELTNRRQYVLLIHQLQHEVIESQDLIRTQRVRLADELDQLKQLIGLRTSVPKDQVYPKFHSLATTWKALCSERDKNVMRRALLKQLLTFKSNFTSSLTPSDLAMARHRAATDGEEKGYIAPSSFVHTLGEDEGKQADDFARPVRLVKDTVPNFMALPLEYQGYCPWTLVMRGGLLLPGNPNLGVLRYQGRHFSFASYAAMRDFVEDPDKYVDGVIHCAQRNPALIHLLCVQQYIPNTDIAELLIATDLTQDQSITSAPAGPTTSSQTQTVLHPDPDPVPAGWHWNEWVLRRQAIQLADLMNMRTRSVQTELSHFRREGETQTYMPRPLKDGSMPGIGTQTGVEKGTNVERTISYVTGLRGDPARPSITVKYTTPEFVVDGSNGPLALRKPYESWYSP